MVITTPVKHVTKIKNKRKKETFLDQKIQTTVKLSKHMTKTKRNEAGSKFLPHISISSLQKMYKKEKNPKAAARLRVYIMRKEGKTMCHIATALNKPYTTIHSWLVRVSNDGIKNRYDAKIPGRSSKMSPDQLKELRKDIGVGPQEFGFESNVWTAPLLREHIEKKYSLKYATPSIRDILKRMGVSRKELKKSRHLKSASKS